MRGANQRFLYMMFRMLPIACLTFDPKSRFAKVTTQSKNTLGMTPTKLRCFFIGSISFFLSCKMNIRNMKCSMGWKWPAGPTGVPRGSRCERGLVLKTRIGKSLCYYLRELEFDALIPVAWYILWKFLLEIPFILNIV